MDKENSWIIVDRLADIILFNTQGCIVEIGLGSSTLILSKYAKQFNRKHYACDINKRKCDWVKSKINYDKLIIHNESSLEFIKKFDDKIALFFIDGNHKYKMIKEEINFLVPKIVPGGVGFFHDTYIAVKWYERYMAKNKVSDTYKARLDLERRDDVWCLTFPYTAAECGLTMILKKEENRPDYRQ